MFRQLAGSDTWYERYRSMEACAVGKVVPCVEWSVYMEAVDAVHVMLVTVRGHAHEKTTRKQIEKILS